VRRLADGTLEFLGRSDQQVKIRGFRVELQEVESVLHQHPAVRQAVAAGCDDEHGFKRLVAYIVPSGPARPDPSDLRQWLSARLPSYMVPSFFVFLDALPQTPNGKVDRKTLPVLDQPPRQSEEFVAPRTDLEVTLAAICADVLHLDRISVSASLFDLGADSLHIFQIVSRAAQAGTIISAGQVTRLQNIAAVAREAEKMTGAASSSSLPPLVPALREGFRVASSAN
jgi:acyl carrier protein